MLRFLRVLAALALLPIGVGATLSAVNVLMGSGGAMEFWFAFGAGGAAWMLIFALLPKPMWLYVVGHELTHAIWGLLFGARIKSLRATSKGGHVVLSRSNTVIALAPYFFPFYTIVFAIVMLGIRLIWRHPWIDPLFHFGLGVTYAFHATLTLWILRIRQSDITGEGYLLSAVVIWIGNVLTVIVAVPILTGRGAPWEPLYTVFLNTGRSVDLMIHAASVLLHRAESMRVGWR
jgi:hypothetical protein